MQESLNQVVLNFNKDSIFLLNICLAFIMFGVAIELKIEDFKLLLKNPKPVLAGLISQFILLPGVTFLFILFIKPSAGIALGMMLVAACPGGNISNFFSVLSKGNVALSISLTAISSSLSVIFTPINFTFWAKLYKPSNQMLQAVSIDAVNIGITIICVLVIPLIIGMMVNNKFPDFTKKYSGFIRKISILIFATFLIVSLSANLDYFIKYISIILFIVLFHNGLAFITGYSAAWAVNLTKADRKSITIETGIQNSGLALVLIFDFFNGIGSMAIIAAWWGIWDIIAGFIVSGYWSKN